MNCGHRFTKDVRAAISNVFCMEKLVNPHDPNKRCSICNNRIFRIRYLSKIWEGFGQYQKRKYCSRQCSNLGKSHSKLSDNNPMWRGDKVKYAGLHVWIRSRLVKSKKCQKCKKVPPYDLANISQKYKRNLSDWEWLCRRCHMTKDGRRDKLIKRQRAKGEIGVGRKILKCPVCSKICIIHKSSLVQTCSRLCGNILHSETCRLKRENRTNAT